MTFALPLPRSLVVALLAILLLPCLLVASPALQTAELRDITVEADGNSARVTFLVTDKVKTVVVEPGSGGIAEIRMQSLKASSAALGSATLRPGVVSVKAHIERRDVLKTVVKFECAVRSMKVIRRDDEQIVVLVELGPPLGGKGASIAKKGTATKKPAAARNRWALTTIVIDAGHGGKDPGAIGLGDLPEKTVTLAVSRYLRDELRRLMPGVRIVMTRESDRFVELDKRGEIANRRGGKLFISIHCNSMPEKPHPVSGFECYILRPGRSEDAARVTGAENAAVRFESRTEKYKENGADGTIVAGMAQSAFARYSEQAAQKIRQALRIGTPLVDRGVHQAGFYVLVGAAMPAVLVELGYLSSEEDIKVLKSTSGRKKMAKAIANGIVAYQKHYATTIGEK